jgi:hypothetical protein
MHEPTQTIRPLSSLEISGAICGRVFHDLSNLISGIMGNAEYAQNTTVDPANLQKALQAISLSANNAGKLLGQCLPLGQLVSREAFTYEVADQAADIAEAACLAPGWRVVPPAELAGQIKVQSSWLTSAVWQIARATEASGGELEFTCGPAVFPVVWSGPNPNPDQPVREQRLRQPRAFCPARVPGNRPPLQRPDPFPAQTARPSGDFDSAAHSLKSGFIRAEFYCQAGTSLSRVGLIPLPGHCYLQDSPRHSNYSH